MPMLFHQNMRTFGGHSAIRNALYGVCFGQVAAVLPVGVPVAVAGFTEITNASVGLQAQMAVLAQTLDAGINNLLVMQVGTSALGITEYIVVAWSNAQIAVAAAGQVTYDNLARTWTPNAVAAPFANAYIPAPHMDYGALDSRGPAWVAGTIGGVAGIFMFMHNMYSLGDRSGGLVGLRMCAAMVRKALGGAYAAAPVLIGGDFNAAPHDMDTGRGVGLYARAAMAMGVPINTTASNPYDYWLVTNPAVVAANAHVFAQTRVPNASDHSGIGLVL
jgi:hypothetical protein